MSEYNFRITDYDLKKVNGYDKIIINRIQVYNDQGEFIDNAKFNKVVKNLHKYPSEFMPQNRKTISGLNKKDAKAKCKQILDAYEIGSYIDDLEDYRFLLEVFQGHDCWQEKQGVGIKGIYIDKTEYPNNCFWLHRNDNTKTNISYIKCITPPTKRSEIISACRNAIRPIIVDFRNKNVTFGVTKCQFTGEILQKENTHIDHYDLMFYELFKLWFEDKNVDELYSQLIWLRSSVDFKNQALKKDFIDFHNANTHLRAVSKVANLTILKQ